ncbi:MAG: class I SAM-dependent methyltransferase [Candidatus Omnitrophica bacterium]|nr:class I SAM-dependent methyltransferase [Candidatus Omnitrophota bacterium]
MIETETNTNPLREYFEKNDKRLIHKWMHYFDIYHRHFARFCNRQPVVLEFGVSHGGSLQMWKEYFGPGARIYGVDIEPKCVHVQSDGVTVYIGDQQDRRFLRDLKSRIEPVDILIDDGGHTMKQQIVTFEEMYPAVKEPGIYLIEDLHTSYWKKYGGGLRKRRTFIEYSKRLIDYLNAWHIESRQVRVDDFTRSAYSMTYYDSVLVIEKAKMGPPVVRQTGNLSF